MDSSGTLTFDPIKVNTELALKYLLDNNNEFHPILYNYETESKVYIKDGYENKLFTVSMGDEEIKLCALKFVKPIDSSYKIGLRLKKLSQLLEKNAKVFAELEFMIRKIPVEDTKAHIGLIAKNLLCCGKENSRIYAAEDSVTYYKLPMDADTPLLSLGCVAQIVKENACLLILGTKDTAIVCHLFTKLCREVGLNEINFVFMESIPKHLPGILKVDIECMTGCTGVVSEKADLDSAVDIFLTSTTTSPWRLRRILVQECIYDSFKKAVEWKSGLKTSKLTPQSLALQRLCTDLFVYDEKVLLFDYAGPEDSSNPHFIYIEAYRTTKELISLINSYNVHYLSLWSNHISEANEVAFGTRVPIVWINDFATFHGPPKASQAIYSRICVAQDSAINLTDYDIVSAHKSWLRLPLEERREIMLATLESYLSRDALNSEEISSLRSLEDALIDWQSDQTVDVSNDKMCVCIDLPIGIVMWARLLDIVPIVRSVVSGNAVVFNNLSAFHSSLIEKFQTVGVPVAKYERLHDTGSYTKVICDQMFVTRVIWTNFETIFAN